MGKRERENPCGICGHYHKYEEGEACGICGHRMPVVTETNLPHASAFPSEILPDFLYLGSFDNASRSELLKAQGISCIFNTVPSCQNLYKNSFKYHCLENDKCLPFDEASEFLGQCEKDRMRTLVHCMFGKTRSPAIVVAYLMKSKGWSLVQSYQWVKERRPIVDISQATYQQLQEYEQKIFGSTENSSAPPAPPTVPAFGNGGGATSIFGAAPTVPASSIFGGVGAPSIFANPALDNIHPGEFTFGKNPQS